MALPQGFAGPAIQVAELGQIFSSADLNLWIPRVSGTSNDLRAVTFLGTRIIVTGANGTMLYADVVDDFRPGTLTPGATTDWLEAVAASSTLAVAVGDNGAIYTSINGVSWRRQTSGTVEWLRGVTFGGGVWVAVGENGKILSSVNGTNWNPRSSGIPMHFNRVSFGQGRFTAVAEGGLCRFSTNGALNWYAETTGATGDLFNSINANNGTRLAVGDSEVRSQEPPAAWVDELARTNGPTAWTYYSNLRTPETPGLCLIGGRTGLMEEGYLAADGGFAGWMPSDDSVRHWLWDVTGTSDLYVAVGDRAALLTSGNGVDWKLELVPDAVTNSIFLGVGGTTNLLVTVGNGGSLIISPNVVTNQWVTNSNGINNITFSAFGVIWHAMESQTTNDLQGIAVSSNLVVATGAAGTIITSPDGTNWTLRTAPTNRFLSSVTAWPGGWVATGDDGAIVNSANGTAWSLVPPPTTNWLYRVRYLGGTLISVGQNGSIFTSVNGVNWSKQTSGTTKWLNDVAWVDNTWFVVGNSGTVLASSNTVNWSSVGTLTRKNLYGAATDGRQFITVGIEGVILRSQMVPDLTPITILSYDRLSTNILTTTIAYNIYLFGGRPDQQFTLDYRAGFETNVNWAIGPQLEFFDGSGTLFYLETITSTNPPPREFYRATLAIP